MQAKKALGHQYRTSILKFERQYPPRATPAGTLILLAGIFVASILSVSGETPSLIVRPAAISVGIALIISILFDSRNNLKNIFRTDVLCLVSLYYLTLAEFVFPQDEFDNMLNLQETAAGLNVVFVGLGAFAIGRHLVAFKPIQSSWLNFGKVSNQLLFKVFILSAFLGFLYMLMSVNFNIFEMIDAMTGARFTQPWGRGRLGGWMSFITELSLLLYLIPALTGIILNRRKSFPALQLIVVLFIFALTIFHGFAGGTRNVFIAYLAVFLAAYLLTLPRNNMRNTIIPILITFFVATYGSYHMLEFRTMGLRNYVENRVYATDSVRDTLAVDHNLYALALIANTFPNKHNFVGSEILTWSLVKPIPRALWPGKPEGLSISIEEVLGAEGYTVSSTYLGEAYMMAGIAGVIGVSLFFGGLAAWWNRMMLQKQSDYAMVVYALGFFAGSITMRSMFWLTTAILPILALIALKQFGPRSLRQGHR